MATQQELTRAELARRRRLVRSIAYGGAIASARELERVEHDPLVRLRRSERQLRASRVV